MKKKTFIGWIGKTIKENLSFSFTGDVLSDSVYKTKGFKIDWHDNDWPPIKVKVTIEVVE